MNDKKLCTKKGEQFMWVLTKKDGTEINEFDEKGVQRCFDNIQCNSETKNFGIVGQGLFINFDTIDGVFNIIKDKVKPKFIDNNGNDLLFPDGENKLIMFRNAEINMNTGTERIVGYNVGYRVKNEYINARIFVEISLTGLAIHLDFTPSKEIEGELGIYNNGKRVALIQSSDPENPKLFTNRRYKLKLQITPSNR